MNKVWIVQGTTGEYSDRSEWTVYAFHSEAEARAYVELLGVERQKLGDRPWDYAEGRTFDEGMRAFDPGFEEDYTGTRWFVSEVPFFSSAEQVVGSSSRDEDQ